MSILDIARASGGTDCEIPTLELSCPAWSESIFICAGFEDQIFTLEDGRTVTFTAAGLDVSLPKRDNSGSQSLGIAIDNVTGVAQQRIDEAKAANSRITITMRLYLESDPGAPAERPVVMPARTAEMKGVTLQLTGGYFDLINAAWPRRRFTLAEFPGLRYLAQ